MRLARRRDATTWSEIYHQNYPRVYAYIYGHLGLKEESEDLAAQVFLEAMQGIESYRDIAEAEARTAADRASGRSASTPDNKRGPE